MPRTFLISSKTRWRSALSFGSRNTKAPSLVRSSITFFTAALTSSSVKFLVGPVAAEVERSDRAGVGGVFLGRRCRRRRSYRWRIRRGLVGGPQRRRTAKHSAAAIAVARAIETRPRSKPSYIIGLSFLVITGADAPFRCQGTRHRDRPRSLSRRLSSARIASPSPEPAGRRRPRAKLPHGTSCATSWSPGFSHSMSIGASAADWRMPGRGERPFSGCVSLWTMGDGSSLQPLRASRLRCQRRTGLKPHSALQENATSLLLRV